MDTKLGIKYEKPPLDREKTVYVVSVNYKNEKKSYESGRNALVYVSDEGVVGGAGHT